MTTLYKKFIGIVFASIFVLTIITFVIPASAATVAFYDFRLGGYDWNYVSANGSIINFEFGENGMSFTVVAEDPFIFIRVFSGLALIISYTVNFFWYSGY